MKPLLTAIDRSKAVYDFCAGCYNQTTRIKEINPLTYYLNEGFITPLFKLEKSSTYLTYSDGDAKRYVDWLIQVVFGSNPQSEEIIGHANDQLFNIIGLLKDNIEHDQYLPLIPQGKLKEELEDLDERLVNTNKDMDAMDERIMDTLQTIRDWQSLYQPALEDLLDEHNERKRLTKSLKGDDNAEQKSRK